VLRAQEELSGAGETEVAEGIDDGESGDEDIASLLRIGPAAECRQDELDRAGSEQLLLLVLETTASVEIAAPPHGTDQCDQPLGGVICRHPHQAAPREAAGEAERRAQRLNECDVDVWEGG